LTFTPGLTKNNSHLYTATDTVTDLANTEHVGNRQQDAMLTVKGGSALTRWYF